MQDTISPTVLNFFSNNFESIFYFIGILLFSLLVFSFLLSVNIQIIQPLILFMKQLLAVVVIPLIVVFILTGSYVYWQNYFKKVEDIQFPRDLNMTTDWVKGNIVLYYRTGDEFHSIDLNGQNDQILFKGRGHLKEYQFSPNGRQILLLTDQGLFLLTMSSNDIEVIEPVDSVQQSFVLKSVVSNVHWAPASDKFCYEVTKWSEASSNEKVVVYYVDKKIKREVTTSVISVSNLYWDKAGEFLYFLKYAYKDEYAKGNNYEVKVFTIDPTTLSVNKGTTFTTKEKVLPLDRLSIGGIELFTENEDRIFGAQHEQQHQWKSETGRTIGIDEKGYLFFVRNQWFQKRLFHVPQVQQQQDPTKYNYKNDYVLSDFRWLPGGKYVLMSHRYFGVIILDPESGKMGMLTKSKAESFGWYKS